MLANNGARIDIRSSDGATPLIWAASQGHGNVVQTLLAKGSNIKLKDNIFQKNNVKSVLINKPFPSEEILSLNNQKLINLQDNLGTPFLLNFFVQYLAVCFFPVSIILIFQPKDL